MTVFDIVLLALIVVPLTILILPHLRDPLVGLVHAVFEIPAAPFVTFGIGMQRSIRRLSQLIQDGLRGLRFTRSDGQDNDGFAGWKLIVPLLYMVLLVVMVVGDYYVMLARLSAFFGLPATNIPVGQLDLLTGVVWAAMLATLAALFVDAFDIMPYTVPWTNFDGRKLRIYRFVVGVAFGMALLASAILFLWGQFAMEGQTSPLLSTAFVILFAVLLNLAIGLITWVVAPAFTALWVLTLMVVRLSCQVLLLVCELAVRVIRKVYGLIVATVNLPAEFGRRLYNYLSQFDIVKPLHMHPMLPFNAPPIIGDELESLSTSTENHSAPLNDLPRELQTIISTQDSALVDGERPGNSTDVPTNRREGSNGSFNSRDTTEHDVQLVSVNGSESTNRWDRNF